MFAEAVGKLSAEEGGEGCRGKSAYRYANSPLDVLVGRQALANGYLGRPTPKSADLRLPAPPAQFDDEVPEMTRLGPALGEHSNETRVSSATPTNAYTSSLPKESSVREPLARRTA